MMGNNVFGNTMWAGHWLAFTEWPADKTGDRNG